jgi:hypothetical protein
MPGCKAREVIRNEAYFSYAAVTNDEHNEADRRFSTACYELISRTAASRKLLTRM